MQDTPILEISRLQEVFEDDTAGIADLLESAMGTGTTHLRSLTDAIADGRLDDVMKTAHAIKGSSANIGGNEVAEVSGRIETSARAGSWDGIPEAMPALHAAYDRLRAAVVAYRKEVS